MSKPIITELSNEQKSRLLEYRENWKAIATIGATQPIDREKAETAIKATYRVINYPKPTVLFSANPFVAIQNILKIDNFKAYLGNNIVPKFHKRARDHLSHLINRQMEQSLCYPLDQLDFQGCPDHVEENNHVKAFHFPHGIESCVKAQLLKDFSQDEANYSDQNYSDISTWILSALIRMANWANLAYQFDFCISVLGLQYDSEKWQAFKKLTQGCDFVFFFDKVCIVCDRPHTMLLDQNKCLHAEESYALVFPGEYGIYAYHGDLPPEGQRCKHGGYIEPGTKVKLPITGEYGMVVHCWYNRELSNFDCYVAFFGTFFPDKERECKPYILRYSTISLEILD